MQTTFIYKHIHIIIILIIPIALATNLRNPSSLPAKTAKYLLTDAKHNESTILNFQTAVHWAKLAILFEPTSWNPNIFLLLNGKLNIHTT